MVTSNANKAREAAAYFAGVLEVEHVALECPEFRHADIGEIARGKAEFAYGVLSRPLIVDDTATYIRFYRRNDRTNAMELVNLDFSSL